MKRFVISITTLLLCVTTFSAILITVIPPWRMAFGLYVWDSFLLGRYESWHLYQVRPILIAGGVFVATAYLISRSRLWRYALNRAALERAERIFHWRGIEDTYASIHRWLATWYPRICWLLISSLPRELQTVEYRLSVSRPGYMPPNRRYLALVRARMDVASRKWQSGILARRWDKIQSSDTQWGQIVGILHIQRARWCEHQLIDRLDHTIALEPVVSAAMISVEHWILACSHRRIFAKPVPGEDDIRAEVERRLKALQALDLYQSRFWKAAWACFTSCLVPDGESSSMLTVLSTCQELLDATRGLGATGEGYWATGLSQQLVTLIIEWLVAHSYFQEAIQVNYHAEAELEKPFRSALSTNGKNDPVSGSENVWIDRLFYEVFPPLATWAVSLASPAENHWRQALLVEAWQSIYRSLRVIYRGSVQNHDPTNANQMKKIDRAECARLWVIRDGYVGYARDETRSVAVTSKHPILKRI